MAKSLDERKGYQSIADISLMEPRQAHDGRKVDQHSGGSSDLVALELKGRGHNFGNSANDLIIL